MTAAIIIMGTVFLISLGTTFYGINAGADASWVGLSVATTVASLILLIGLMGTSFIMEEHRLTAQCLADGHKEYECAAMLKGNQVYPVAVPVVVGR